MQSTKEIWKQDLEQLIREKPFEALTVEERAMVLTELDAGEYRRLRDTALLAARYLERPLHTPPLPRADIQPYLRQRLRRRKRWAQRLGQVLEHRIPVWQAAAAAVVLVLTLQLGGNPQFGAGLPAVNGSLLADSTLHDSAVHPVWDSHEDTSHLHREADTL